MATIEYIVVMECEEDDTPNYMVPDGWVGDITAAQRFGNLEDAELEAWAACEDAEPDWRVEIKLIEDRSNTCLPCKVIKAGP